LVQSKRKADVLFTIQKSTIWDTTSSLVILEAIVETLQKWCLKINKHDQCVAKKVIKGKQCTIIWHANDLKILHADKEVVKDILKQLATKFSAPLTTNRVKVLENLGMRIDYCKKGKITSKKY